MKLDRYELKAEKSLMVYEFISEGPKGKIAKLVQFGETNFKEFYYQMLLSINTLHLTV